MDLVEKVNKFPKAPGTYLMKDAEGRDLYVGKALAILKMVFR